MPSLIQGQKHARSSPTPKLALGHQMCWVHVLVVPMISRWRLGGGLKPRSFDHYLPPPQPRLCSTKSQASPCCRSRHYHLRDFHISSDAHGCCPAFEVEQRL